MKDRLVFDYLSDIANCAARRDDSQPVLSKWGAFHILLYRQISIGKNAGLIFIPFAFNPPHCTFNDVISSADNVLSIPTFGNEGTGTPRLFDCYWAWGWRWLEPWHCRRAPRQDYREAKCGDKCLPKGGYFYSLDLPIPRYL